MSCLLTKARAKGCKNGMGGLRKIWFINKAHLDETKCTFDPTNANIITAISATPTAIKAYQYEISGNAQFSQPVTTSIENGTTFVTQELSIVLHEVNAGTDNDFKILAQGEFVIIVETNMGQFRLLGLMRGASMIEGSSVYGATEGDMVGYTAKFVAKEYDFAYFLDDTPVGVGLDVVTI